jgi:hypothetical protein
MSTLALIAQSTTTLIECHAAAQAVLRLGGAQSRIVLEVVPLMRGEKGAKGDSVKGDKGDTGATGGAFEFVQSTPAAMWTVNHNLGFKPAVKALTVGGVEMWAEVIHANSNQVFIYFDAPTAGIATCS